MTTREAVARAGAGGRGRRRTYRALVVEDLGAYDVDDGLAEEQRAALSRGRRRKPPARPRRERGAIRTRDMRWEGRANERGAGSWV